MFNVPAKLPKMMRVVKDPLQKWVDDWLVKRLVVADNQWKTTEHGLVLKRGREAEFNHPFKVRIFRSGNSRNLRATVQPGEVVYPRYEESGGDNVQFLGTGQQIPTMNGTVLRESKPPELPLGADQFDGLHALYVVMTYTVTRVASRGITHDDSTQPPNKSHGEQLRFLNWSANPQIAVADQQQLDDESRGRNFWLIAELGPGFGEFRQRLRSDIYAPNFVVEQAVDEDDLDDGPWGIRSEPVAEIENKPPDEDSSPPPESPEPPSQPVGPPPDGAGPAVDIPDASS